MSDNTRSREDVIQAMFSEMGKSKDWMEAVVALSVLSTKLGNIEFTRLCHTLIDKRASNVLNRIIRLETNCNTGCNYCCSSKIPVYPEEFKSIERHIKDQQIEFDISMVKQQKASIDNGQWLDESNDFRMCVFIKRDGGCAIYECRPIRCRTFYVSNKTPCEDVAPNELVKCDTLIDPLFALIESFLFTHFKNRQPLQNFLLEDS